jgi:hypothetical protein
MKAVVIAIVASLAAPAIAYACANETHPIPMPVINDLKDVEEALEKGHYNTARTILEHSVIEDEALKTRSHDMWGLIMLRDKRKKDDAKWVLQHFVDRQKKNPKDPRFKAWLAEAYLVHGKQADALALITDLMNKDLMPDAYAYMVFAKLTDGEERASALAVCKTRSKNALLCSLPKARRA